MPSDDLIEVLGEWEGYRVEQIKRIARSQGKPLTVWIRLVRVLRTAGLLRRWNTRTSRKGTGFVQPLRPHDHWHTDISYVNIAGTFYYLCSVLDGCSRYIVHWEIRESMRESDVEIVLQRAMEMFPDARPRIISDNGPQFIAKDFKEFVRISGMTHVRTSPYYPQSNGKLERFHKSIKHECLRPGTPLTLADARRLVERYVTHYNDVRLHSAIGYVAPADKLNERDDAIFVERDRKLADARETRRQRRQALRRNTKIETVACPRSSVASASPHPIAAMSRRRDAGDNLGQFPNQGRAESNTFG